VNEAIQAQVTLDVGPHAGSFSSSNFRRSFRNFMCSAYPARIIITATTSARIPKAPAARSGDRV
jgi:hypothetical protein